MKKLSIVLLLLIATPCFAMSNRPAKLNVKPDTLINNQYPATFNGANVSINRDYLSSTDVYPKGNMVFVQFRLGTVSSDNLSYCLNLPAHEVGLVGRKAFDKSHTEFKSWSNPKIDSLSGAIETSGNIISLNTKNIESVYASPGFVADKNKNGCGNPYGDYPNWQFNIIMEMSLAEYNDIKDQL